jgi:4-aminobutyrate aminotransferase-like enzyme
VLEVIETERLTENARVVGAYLKQRLEELQPRYPSIGDVRGVGLSLGVELVRENERPNPLLAELVINGLRNSGVMIARTGEFNHVLKIRPPMVASIENCDFFLGLFEKILAASQGKSMTLTHSKL